MWLKWKNLSEASNFSLLNSEKKKQILTNRGFVPACGTWRIPAYWMKKISFCWYEPEENIFCFYIIVSNFSIDRLCKQKCAKVFIYAGETKFCTEDEKSRMTLSLINFITRQVVRCVMDHTTDNGCCFHEIYQGWLIRGSRAACGSLPGFLRLST